MFSGNGKRNRWEGVKRPGENATRRKREDGTMEGPGNKPAKNNLPQPGRAEEPSKSWGEQKRQSHRGNNLAKKGPKKEKKGKTRKWRRGVRRAPPRKNSSGGVPPGVGGGRKSDVDKYAESADTRERRGEGEMVGRLRSQDVLWWGGEGNQRQVAMGNQPTA